jgi:hypothetical protein
MIPAPIASAVGPGGPSIQNPESKWDGRVQQPGRSKGRSIDSLGSTCKIPFADHVPIAEAIGRR